MVSAEQRKRKRTSSTTMTTRQLAKKSTILQEWTVPSLTLERNHFSFDGSMGDRPECFLVTAGPNHHNVAAKNDENQQEQHAVFCFSCHWYDQGWGDRQGRILIVEQDRPKTFLNARLLSIPFRNGRLVAMSPLVQHEKRPLMLFFQPKPNKLYQFWTIVGGGGYNELHLGEVVLRKHMHSRHSKASPLDTAFIPFVHERNGSSFLLAPLDVKRKIVSFLSPSDVIRLMSVRKSCAAELGISQVPTPLLGSEKENKAGWANNSPQPSCFAVYNPKRANQLHSVVFQCTISIPDYGWWCLGPVTISIVAQSKDARQHHVHPQMLPYEQGRLVSKRSIVYGNCKMPMTLTFFPKQDDCYQVWLSRDSSFVSPTSGGLTIVENPTFRTIGYGKNSSESFMATYIGFPRSPPKVETARDLVSLSNGMGQTIHQLMRLHGLRARGYQLG